VFERRRDGATGEEQGLGLGGMLTAGEKGRQAHKWGAIILGAWGWGRHELSKVGKPAKPSLMGEAIMMPESFNG